MSFASRSHAVKGFLETFRDRLVAALTVLSLGSIGIAVYYYVSYTQLSPGESGENADQIVARLESFVVLPKETPTLAQVEDPTKITNTFLSSKAKKGDIILLFSQASWMILYRPSTGKLVDTYPLVQTTASVTPDVDTPALSVKDIQ